MAAEETARSVLSKAQSLRDAGSSVASARCWGDRLLPVLLFLRIVIARILRLRSAGAVDIHKYVEEL